MPQLYKTNLLCITEITEHSTFVGGGEHGNIPLREAPNDAAIGDHVEAFVYRDSADEIVATMAQAQAKVGECAYLEVVSIAEHGAFLEWGLPKDLFLPFAEQTRTLEQGDHCVVYIYTDASGRPLASARLHRHLNEEKGDLTIGESVDLMIASKSDLGFKAVINNQHLGLIFHKELSQPLELGSKIKGWIKGIRTDGKINLNINALDEDSRYDLEDEILEQLVETGGRINLSDKSAPEDIFAAFQVSKKNFKRALGSLYKQRIITIAQDHIALVDKTNAPSPDKGSQGDEK